MCMLEQHTRQAARGVSKPLDAGEYQALFDLAQEHVLEMLSWPLLHRPPPMLARQISRTGAHRLSWTCSHRDSRGTHGSEQQPRARQRGRGPRRSVFGGEEAARPGVAHEV